MGITVIVGTTLAEAASDADRVLALRNHQLHAFTGETRQLIEFLRPPIPRAGEGAPHIATAGAAQMTIAEAQPEAAADDVDSAVGDAVAAEADSADTTAASDTTDQEDAPVQERTAAEEILNQLPLRRRSQTPVRTVDEDANADTITTTSDDSHTQEPSEDTATPWPTADTPRDASGTDVDDFTDVDDGPLDGPVRDHAVDVIADSARQAARSATLPPAATSDAEPQAATAAEPQAAPTATTSWSQVVAAAQSDAEDLGDASTAEPVETTNDTDASANYADAADFGQDDTYPAASPMDDPVTSEIMLVIQGMDQQLARHRASDDYANTPAAEESRPMRIPLDPETSDVIDRAQQILSELPGSVVPRRHKPQDSQ